jgi:hypothetical protein
MSTPPPQPTFPRLVPERPLPPYSFVPGRFPHPVADPAGHSFGVEPAPPAMFDPKQWTASEAYLYGIDLFNAGYYWESHVEWESLWLACGRSGDAADFLKGLIKLAAAGVKHLEAKPAGVQSHACRAAILWREVARSPGATAEPFLGFPIEKLIALAAAICTRGWPAEPVVLAPTFPQTSPQEPLAQGLRRS